VRQPLWPQTPVITA